MIGFIQGRLVPQVNGMIQAFPWDDWKEEYRLADSIDMRIMEWTLDQSDLYDNPLMTQDGQKTIRELCDKYRISIPNLTGDCFMQAPFWKAETTQQKDSLLKDFEAVSIACSKVGIRNIVVPLVDNGSLDSPEQQDCLIAELLKRSEMFKQLNVTILFESDFKPGDLAQFIKKLPVPTFGINYDSGNSAALGFDVEEEWAAYSDRIINLHIKDREYQGTTVPLGTGATNFSALFSCMKNARYEGYIILQTARATDGNHLGAIQSYRDFVSQGLDLKA
ncbi:Sugar phosphate isomerase/epimerase [Cohaesibacter gelatinilyticus]|uniref:Sugar phosphate isomerase/epimerase n=2 Tax=Cohaesibacter gelatinilyticus TaxID=372072 RepID=A0A285NHW1_9HYPH|nr:Sugar phosphate isomerase/epimerase [Cohaesibacter gelatinilyticus]